MNVDKKPCVSCPYRVDVPSGVWSKSEYEKLRGYDGETWETDRASFLCHNTSTVGAENDTLCRGWLTTHPESLAVRFLMLEHKVTVEQIDADPGVPLHASGNEAADFGERDIDNPSPACVAFVQRMLPKQNRKKAKRGR